MYDSRKDNNLDYLSRLYRGILGTEYTTSGLPDRRVIVLVGSPCIGLPLSVEVLRQIL